MPNYLRLKQVVRIVRTLIYYLKQRFGTFIYIVCLWSVQLPQNSDCLRNNINRLVFVMETQRFLLCDVQTGSGVMYAHYSLKRNKSFEPVFRDRN